MTDKLIPTESDQLGTVFGQSDEPTGIPSLSLGQGNQTVHKGESKFSGQVVIASVVLVLAAGAIYGMRVVGLNAGLGGEQIKIDYTSQTSSTEQSRRYNRVMSELDASLSAVQLADAGVLPTTPFTRPTAAVQEPMVFEDPTSMDDLERLSRMASEQRRQEQEARAAMLNGELARLHVQSIIIGGVPAARINGVPLTIGRTLGPFTISEITRQAVYVTADGLTWELQIGLPARLMD